MWKKERIWNVNSVCRDGNSPSTCVEQPQSHRVNGELRYAQWLVLRRRASQIGQRRAGAVELRKRGKPYRYPWPPEEQSRHLIEGACWLHTAAEAEEGSRPSNADEGVSRDRELCIGRFESRRGHHRCCCISKHFSPCPCPCVFLQPSVCLGHEECFGLSLTRQQRRAEAASFSSAFSTSFLPHLRHDHPHLIFATRLTKTIESRSPWHRIGAHSIRYLTAGRRAAKSAPGRPPPARRCRGWIRPIRGGPFLSVHLRALPICHPD